MRIRKRYIWPILFIAYIAAVAYLCFMKPDDIPQMRPDIFGIPIDKVMHFLMFFPYPVVAYGVFRGREKRLWTDILAISLAFITGAGLAMGTEYVQGLLEYRSYDINDFKADMAGIGLSSAAILIYILITIRERLK